MESLIGLLKGCASVSYRRLTTQRSMFEIISFAVNHDNHSTMVRLAAAIVILSADSVKGIGRLAEIDSGNFFCL
jgi:hypothetical protein